ncbi:MAG: hypothetical protein EBW59_03390 [Betaproteobacteria bacterium]|nr:hypothetical protein [Betaproteobacteria bacterium]
MSFIKSKSELIEYFLKGIKNQNQLKIGVEHEKFLFSGKEKRRVNYEELKIIFKKLEKFDWKPIYEKESIIGLKRGEQQITTEPGLQYELSGAPLKIKSEQMLSKVKKISKNKLLIISVGGIMTADDALKRIRMGADLVQIYTGLIYQGPSLVNEIRQKLS